MVTLEAGGREVGGVVGGMVGKSRRVAARLREGNLAVTHRPGV